MKWALSVMFFSLLISSCEETDPTFEECILESIQLDEQNQLEYVTISGGEIYQVRQKYKTEGKNETIASYRYYAYTDSLVVLDELNPGKYPFMRVKYQNDVPQQIVRHFPTEDVLLTHDIYYDQDMIEVRMSRVASTGDFAELAYGLYYLGEKGNVLRVEKYRADFDYQFYKYEESFFQYDQGFSPLDGLLIPFFVGVRLPDVEFFSPANIVVNQQTGARSNYSYEYTGNGLALNQIAEDGSVISFNYLNCYQ